MIAFVIGKLKGWLVGAGAAVAIIFGAYIYGRKEGKQAAEARRAAENQKAIKEARRVEDEIRGSSDADIDKRFNKWLRD